MFSNHRVFLLVSLSLTACVGVGIILGGCTAPKNPDKITDVTLDGNQPDYLSDEPTIYDKEVAKQVRQAAKTAQGGGPAPAGSDMSFADVEIPADLKTIDPASLDKAPSNLANPAFVLDLVDGGQIVAELFADKAPLTVNHFIPVVQSGYYTNVYWQRAEDMCIQCGDPRVNGGDAWPRTVALEISGESYTAGSLGMARTDDPNSASAQIFFTRAPAPSLDSGYANFGMALSGMDSIMAVPDRDQANQGAPLDEGSRISQASLVRFRGYEEAEADLLSAAEEESEEAGEEAASPAIPEGHSADDGHNH